MSEPLPDPDPVELRVAPHGAALAIVWADGASALIAAARLRQACRCASCAAARTRGEPIAAEASIAIAAVEPIGGYAVNIAFSDGHARGIYPWAFLRELGGTWSPNSN
jgi:prepilin-type processing-associated H-X9-DG protein